MMMRIGFDLDGVILDHTKKKIALARQYGWQLEPAQTHSDRMDEYLPEPLALMLKRKLYQNTAAPLFTGVRETLKKLTERRSDYVLVSRRYDPQAAITNLKHHGVWPDLFSQANTYFVDADSAKRAVAQKLHLTHYIDDAITVLRLLESVPHRILFDPLASLADWPDYHKYRVVRSWKGIGLTLLGPSIARP